jgi:hypothetical protein
MSHPSAGLSRGRPRRYHAEKVSRPWLVPKGVAMVHKQVQPLLALGLVGLEWAKQLFVWRLVAHCGALGLAVTAALLTDQGNTMLLQIAAGAAIACEILAFILHHWASDLHSRGREVMRRVMILDALSPEEALIALERNKNRFSDSVVSKAVAFQARDQQLEVAKQRLHNYYYSRKPEGQARLRDHLFESAIFSHHLYAAAWRFSLVCLIALLGGAAIVVAVLVLGSPASGQPREIGALLVRLLIALVAFVPASQEVDHLLLYRAVEHQLGDLLKRVEALYAQPLTADLPNSQLLADLGDYCAATTVAPPIRTLVYKALVDRLVVEFEQKMRELETK